MNHSAKFFLPLCLYCDKNVNFYHDFSRSKVCSSLKIVLAWRLTSLVFCSCFINIMSLSSLTAQDDDTRWWKPTYEKGMELLQEEQLEAAEKQFKMILARDQKVPEAYYGLGLVYHRQKPGSGDAKKHLQVAVQKDPTLVDAWIELAKVQEEFGDTGEVMSAYANAMKYSPNNKEIYSQFINVVILYNKEDKALPILTDLTQEYPDEPEYLFDLAYVNYVKGNHEECLSILDRIKLIFPNLSSCRIYFVQAKINFDNDRDAEGLAYYWSAVNSIQDKADANAFFNDTRYIMNNWEYDELQATPVDKIWKFYYRFWRSRDPNLATEINERIPEHYRRLRYARKWYSRSIEGGVNDERYKLEHPLREFMISALGDELLNHHLSKAIYERRDLDDLGLIHVRHGNPDKKITYVTEVADIPANISLKYNATYNRSEMVFHFSKWDGNRGWIMSLLPTTFVNRWELGGDYMRLDPQTSTYDKLLYSDKVRMYMSLESENIEHARTGVRTETSEYEYDEVLLNFPFEVLSYKGENGKVLVELYYGVRGQETKLSKTSEGTVLILNKFISFYDERWNEVGVFRKENRVRVGLTPEAWKQSGIVDVERFNVSPGIYHYEFQLRDKTSNKLGVYKGIYKVNNYWQEDLILSDIIVSGPLHPAEGNVKFKKEDVEYSPHMFSDFKMGEIVGLYFELYNLMYDNDGKTNFRITCTLQHFGADGKSRRSIIGGFFKSLLGQKKEIVGTSYDYSGQNRDEKIYFNFDLEERRSGKYELVIDVWDLNGDNKVSKKVAINIK